MGTKPLTQLRALCLPAPQSDLMKAVEMFLLDCEARRLTPKSLRFYRQQLTAAATYLDERGIVALASLVAITVNTFISAV